MSPNIPSYKKSCLMILLAGLLSCSVCSAARVGGVGGIGGYDHGVQGSVGTFNDNGSYNRGG